MNKISLYKKDAKGALRIWSIEANEIDGELYIEFGVLNGSMQEKIEDVETKGNRTIEEQTLLRLESRVNKQRDKGYVSGKKEAQEMENNKTVLGNSRPMLALRFKGQDITGAHIQYKYNGHRCVISKQPNGNYLATSKNGKVINSIDHIMAGMNLPTGLELDGELYHHGTSLQTISSWVKRKQPDSLKLIFVCFDMITDIETDTFEQRYEKILQLSRESRIPNVTIAKTLINLKNSHIPELFQDARKQGYEGLIVRMPNGIYRPGVRSNKILKVKECIDSEFLVVDITASVDGWAILHCANKEGNKFKVSAFGSIKNKEQIFKDREKHIGKMVRVEYAELTEDKFPFHPVALGWREKQVE